MGRIGTLNPQPWQWAGDRVVVEHPDEQAGLAIASALRDAGFAVALCSGPSAGERCPLTHEEGCAAVAGAGAVVSALGVERREAREVLDALALYAPKVPVVVGLPAAAGEAVPPTLPRRYAVVDPSTPPELVVAAVRAALGSEA